MNARQRKRRAKRINEANLAPKIREGLTQGASLEEAMQEHPVQKAGHADLAAMRNADQRLERGRDGFAQFVATNSNQAVWTDGVTDRKQMDVNKSYTPAGKQILQEGRQCLRCDEPFDESFPVECPVCGYAVKDRQIMDIAMEFEGLKHIGPSAPITQYMEEQEARLEKRRFIRRIIDGGQGRVPKEWLRDATLLDGLTPRERQMIGAK